MKRKEKEIYKERERNKPIFVPCTSQILKFTFHFFTFSLPRFPTPLRFLPLHRPSIRENEHGSLSHFCALYLCICRMNQKKIQIYVPAALLYQILFVPLQPQKGNAVIAQLVERILGKDEVPSSNLGNSSDNQERKRPVKGFIL